jgi:hypothetical protein
MTEDVSRRDVSALSAGLGVAAADVEKCEMCGADLHGMWIGTGTGAAHRHCYYKQHPPRAAQTIFEMARGVGDPMLAAQVIAEMMPPNLGCDMVSEFNRRLMKQWLRLCEP